MNTPNIPLDTQAAFKAGITFAETLYAGRTAGPAFALIRNDAGETVHIFSAEHRHKAQTLEQIRQVAPKLARDSNAYAVTFGATALIAAPKTQSETDQLKRQLAGGASLADRPGSTPALILEHHTKTHITRAAYLIDHDGDIIPEPHLTANNPTDKATPIANIRFFPA